ncbi:MAG: hypothetical protein H0X61_09400, partial [Acidimicrobiia bacterium]|nr:hypothetical protein [Acidimicrobiia bacterium]
MTVITQTSRRTTADPPALRRLVDLERLLVRARRPMGYQPGLDGVRALSVLAVILYHGGISWLPGGFFGVEVSRVHPWRQPDLHDDRSGA